MLSKVFIVHRPGAYSTNQRKEISKSSKWYFYDNGIRKTIINDFRLLTLRTDTGILWENYLLAGRIKKNTYDRKNVQYFFWRNYNQQEVDLIEREEGQLRAYEFKYSTEKQVKVPPAFASSYPGTRFEVISKKNYLPWIT